MTKQSKQSDTMQTAVGISVIGLIVLVIIAAIMFGYPRYKVWQQEMDGKAEFAKAEQNRKIKIEEARANLEAEKLNAQAEIERAKGAAKAIASPRATSQPPATRTRKRP